MRRHRDILSAEHPLLVDQFVTREQIVIAAYT
jgi:hypothetical protein